jgi:hypothetical protein
VKCGFQENAYALACHPTDPHQFLVGPIGSVHLCDARKIIWHQPDGFFDHQNRKRNQQQSLVEQASLMKFCVLGLHSAYALSKILIWF